MNTTPRRKNAARLAVFLFLVSTAFGQTPGTGAISGAVYDPSGRVVTSAYVLALNEATHLSRSVTTTPEGGFRVPLLPPGMYDGTVKAPGYADRTSPSIQVTVSETSSLTVLLAVAGATTNVRVTSSSGDAELES